MGAMKKRKFCFDIPATLMICVDATTEAEAWLQIKQHPSKHFSAMRCGGDKEDWFVCTPSFESAKLVGFECPPDIESGEQNDYS